MKFGRYTSNPAEHPGAKGSTYEAFDDDKVKGIVEVAEPHVTGKTEYPTHPAMRPSREAMFGPGRHIARSPESSAMNGVRGQAATGDYRMESYDSAWADATAESDGQIPLVQHRSTQHPGTVDYMRTTKGARAVAGPLLGLAVMDQADKGNAVQPSKDLSAHSAPVVRKLNQNLGTQFSTARTNDLTFNEYGEDQFGLGEPLSPSEHEFSRDEVNRGRNFMRRQLRRTPATPDHGYGQMSIFDAGA